MVIIAQSRPLSHQLIEVNPTAVWHPHTISHFHRLIVCNNCRDAHYLYSFSLIGQMATMMASDWVLAC